MRSAGCAPSSSRLAGDRAAPRSTVRACSSTTRSKTCSQLAGHQRVDVLRGPRAGRSWPGSSRRWTGSCGRSASSRCISREQRRRARPRARPPARSRRRTSRGRSAATGSSRTPTGSRAGPSRPPPLSGRARGPRAEVQVAELVDRRRGEEVRRQVRVVDQPAVGRLRRARHHVHRGVPARSVRRVDCAGSLVQHRRLERGGERSARGSPGRAPGRRYLSRDDLALLGHLDLAVERRPTAGPGSRRTVGPPPRPTVPPRPWKSRSRTPCARGDVAQPPLGAGGSPTARS